MSNIKLDLSKFKHIKSDDHTTTLQHKDGHILTLAHSKLAKDNQDQLKAMVQPKNPERARYDEGTPDHPVSSADIQPDSNPNMSQMPIEQIAQPQSEQIPDDLAAKRAIYNKMVPASGVGDTQNFQEAIKAKQFGPNGEEPQNFDPNAWHHAEAQFQQDQAAKQQATEQQTNQDIKTNQARQAAGLEPIASPVPVTAIPSKDLNPIAQQQAQALAPQETAKSTPQSQGNDPEGTFLKGYQESLYGLQGEAQARGQLGEQQAQQHEEAAQAQQKALDSYQQTFQGLNQERDNLIHDINNSYVSPDKFWKGDPTTGEGGHSKIAAGIGMILAGFNPTNRPNAAIEFLNTQMNRSLEAQAKNLQTKDNLLAHNLQQFGNLRDAATFSRIQMQDIAAHQLDAAAGQAAGPVAKAQAMKASGDLRMQAANQMRTFAMQRAMMGLANSTGGSPNAIGQMISQLRVWNPEAAKEMEGRYVPNIGLASVPIPNDVRQQIVAHKSVNDLMNTSLEFSRQHAGTLSPTLRNQAETIQQQLIGSIKQAQHDGVYKPSEAEFLIGQIGGSPASFMAKINSVPKLRQLQQIKQQEFSNLMNTYGLPNQQLPHSNANEGKTGTLPDGTKVKMVNGKLVKI